MCITCTNIHAHARTVACSHARPSSSPVVSQATLVRSFPGRGGVGVECRGQKYFLSRAHGVSDR